MKITAADCGEDVMSERLAWKITGDIPPSIVEIISRGGLERLCRQKLVNRTVSRAEREVFYGARKERGVISERLFNAIAGKELYCFVNNGIVYVQMDIDGRSEEFSVPWFAVKALVFDDKTSI